VADQAALRDLGKALIKAAQSPYGFERVQLHTSDGHEYTAMIVAGVSEEEWQTVTPAYAQSQLPDLDVLNDYKKVYAELKKSVDTRQ
jgi:hypothetical protein